MMVNIENCIRQAARIIRRNKDDGGYAYILHDELLKHLKELRDDPAKHGEFFNLYRFSDGKNPSPGGPVPMLLHCPECRARHIDAGEFATKPHHTHACQSCGMVWRPAIGPTVGVQFLPGFKDSVFSEDRGEKDPCRAEATPEALDLEAVRSLILQAHTVDGCAMLKDNAGECPLCKALDRLRSRPSSDAMRPQDFTPEFVTIVGANLGTAPAVQPPAAADGRGA